MPRGQGRSQLALARCGRGGATTITSTSACAARDGDKECEGQPDQGGDDGCKPAELAYWFKDSIIHPKPEPPKPPPKLTDGITLAQMPAACKAVLNAPDSKQYAKQ